MAEAWTIREVGARAEANSTCSARSALDPDAGVSGLAIRTRQVEWTGDYLDDERFEHTPERDAFVREVGIRSVIAAPLDPPRRRRRRDHRLRRPASMPSTPTMPPSSRARRPGRHRDRQRPADRGARALAGRDRPAGRLGADPARDRGPRVGDPRPGRGPPADRRGGDPPARVGRRPDRPLRPRDRRAALVLRRGRRDGRRAGMGDDERPQARPGRRRDGVRRAAPGRGPTTTSSTSGSTRDDPAREFVDATPGIRSVIAVPLGG